MDQPVTDNPSAIDGELLTDLSYSSSNRQISVHEALDLRRISDSVAFSRIRARSS